VKGGETDAVADSLIRARAGDRLAFASLVRRYQRLVYSLALRMLSDGHEAEDLAQEVFMQLHRRLDRIESDAHLLFWLRKVTTNLAIDRLRQERKAAILPLDEDPGIADETPRRARFAFEDVPRVPANAFRITGNRIGEPAQRARIVERRRP